MLTEKFDKEKYVITEVFTTTKKSNLLLLLILLPLYIIGVCVYLLQNHYANIFVTIFKATFLLEIFILAFGVFAFMAIALLAKAVLLSVFSEGKFKNVKFKIIKETQKPYCCLAEPVTIGQYQLCLAVYILIMAVIPYIIALIIGDFIFVLASFLCAFFAGGDILFFISLFGWKKGLKASNGLYVMDFEGIMMYRIYAGTDKL